MGVQRESQSCLVKFVYAYSDKQKMKCLLECLTYISRSVEGLWILVGDFNSITSSNEKRRGQSLPLGCKLFQNFIRNSSLQDLGFRGPQFTWSRGDI